MNHDTPALYRSNPSRRSRTIYPPADFARYQWLVAATFKAIDLHVHTGALGRRTRRLRRSFSHRHSLEQALAVDLDCNRGSPTTTRSRAAAAVLDAARGTPLTVFPGVEISTSEGHLLAIFDPLARAVADTRPADDNRLRRGQVRANGRVGEGVQSPTSPRKFRSRRTRNRRPRAWRRRLLDEDGRCTPARNSCGRFDSRLRGASTCPPTRRMSAGEIPVV